MKKNTLVLLLSSAIVLGLGSCKKTEGPKEDLNFTSTVVIEFDHLVNGRKIQKDTEYKTALDQDFTVNVLRYFVSNIKFVGADGSTYVVPKDDSYFLINAFGDNGGSGHGEGENNAGGGKVTEISIDGVPAGRYSKLIFTLGVDAEKSKSPAEERTGVLDPAIGHNYWAWNSGYVFLAIEGTSSDATTQDNRYRYHIGGFGGYDTQTHNNIKVIELDLTQKGVIELLDKERKSQVHLFVNIDKIFNGEAAANHIDISEVSTIMSINDNSVKVANNYSRLFTHDHTHN